MSEPKTCKCSVSEPKTLYLVQDWDGGPAFTDSIWDTLEAAETRLALIRSVDAEMGIDWDSLQIRTTTPNSVLGDEFGV